jgi:biofilm protein TabA
MILDTLFNINRYVNFDNDIYSGLEYLSRVNSNIKVGEYIISQNVKMIVSEYSTKIQNNEQYEAHRHTIDIQYPIVGTELVQWSPLNDMIVCKNYDIKNDRTYYKNPSHKMDCIIGDGIFAIYFPEDAHNPQHAPGIYEEVIKKITIKVDISN